MKAHGPAQKLSHVIDSEAQRGGGEVIAVREPTHKPNRFESVTLAHVALFLRPWHRAPL